MQAVPPSDLTREDDVVATNLEKMERSVDDLDSFLEAFHAIWVIKHRYERIVKLESLVERAAAEFPSSFLLKLYHASLPAKRLDFQTTADRCLSLLDAWGENQWVYFNGFPAAIAAADYQSASVFADLALEHYRGWGLDHLSMHLNNAPKLGEHDLVKELYSFFLREQPDQIPSHLNQRFAWFFHNTQNSAFVRDVKLISLGEGCFPWCRLAAWGLRPDTWRPAAQMPFNLGMQGLGGCRAMLANRFEGLTDPKQLGVITEVDGIPLLFHRKYRFIFNHEAGNRWIGDNYSEFRRLYDKRVQNFLGYGCEGPRVYVWYLHRTSTAAGIEEQIAEIARDDDYRIVVIDVREAKDDWTPRDPRTTHLRVKLPWPGYFWVDFGSQQSAPGVAFEKEIHDGVRAAMKAVADNQRPSTS